MRLLLAIVLAFLPSCGAMLSRTSYNVPIDSTPKGATVRYLGSDVGVTPCTVTMRRKSLDLELVLDGHHPQPVSVGYSATAWPFASLLMFGPLGVFVDIASGRGWQIDETALLVPMTPSSMAVPAKWKRQPPPVKREKATTSPGDAWQDR